MTAPRARREAAQGGRVSMNPPPYGSGQCACRLCAVTRSFNAAREAGAWQMAEDAFEALFELKAESETEIWAEVNRLRDALKAAESRLVSIYEIAGDGSAHQALHPDKEAA